MVKQRGATQSTEGPVTRACRLLIGNAFRVSYNSSSVEGPGIVGNLLQIRKRALMCLIQVSAYNAE